ncbi:MAG TPA: beta-ketoacyl-[acyl-carrier-protein] synthase family protein [Candidatus Hypogeohydataceae bacterium YC41]
MANLKKVERQASTKKKVVITGIGIISPLGIGHKAFWTNLVEGRSGVSPITSIDVSSYPCKLAAEVRDFNAGDYLGDKGLKYLTKGTKFLASAIKLALEDAQLQNNGNFPEYAGVIIGSALGNYSQTTDYTYNIFKLGPDKLLPMASYDVALNSSINFASVFFKLKGPSRTISSGFTSSIDAIGNAFNLIRNNSDNLLITGGVEQISLDSYLLFLLQGLLSGSHNSGPEKSSPFDKHRNGFVLGEGSYVLILEELDSALRRGAKIYAEVMGYGTTYVGSNRFDLEEKTRRVQRAMELALEDGALSSDSLDLIYANGNSSKLLDMIEARAIKNCLGNTLENVLIASAKPLAGECYGASGAMQVASCALSMENSLVPPIANLQVPDPECNLNLVTKKSLQRDVHFAMVNSIDPAGSCSCLILGKGQP